MRGVVGEVRKGAFGNEPPVAVANAAKSVANYRRGNQALASLRKAISSVIFNSLIKTAKAYFPLSIPRLL